MGQGLQKHQLLQALPHALKISRHLLTYNSSLLLYRPEASHLVLDRLILTTAQGHFKYYSIRRNFLILRFANSIFLDRQ